MHCAECEKDVGQGGVIQEVGGVALCSTCDERAEERERCECFMCGSRVNLTHKFGTSKVCSLCVEQFNKDPDHCHFCNGLLRPGGFAAAWRGKRACKACMAKLTICWCCNHILAPLDVRNYCGEWQFPLCPICDADVSKIYNLTTRLKDLQEQHPDKYCKLCYRGPVADVAFLAVKGMLNRVGWMNIEGHFCRVCGSTIASQVMGEHLKTTWWSPSALLIGAPLGVAKNAFYHAKLARLKSPRLRILHEHNLALAESLT